MPRGGFLGSIGAALGGGIKGLLTGGPVGAIKGAVVSSVKYNMNSGASGAAKPIGSSDNITPMVTPVYSGVNNASPEELADLHRASIAKGQRTGAIQGRPGAGAVITGGSQRLLASGGVRKRPHMRVTNPKALRRALRRAEGFKKLAMKTIKLVSPRTKGRFGGWKKSKRR